MQVYERKSFPRTARDLKTMFEKGNLSFDNAVQRSFVWKNTSKDNKMSMLIDSMMRGFPIPPMYCNCIFDDPKKKIYDFLDGQQRTMTIIKFLKDEFSLINIPVFEEESGEEIDLNGFTYSQLPEEYQDRVKTYSLIVYYFENMEPEDTTEMFRRLNNGKSLTAIELTRANAVSMEKIIGLGKHELFNVAMTETSLAAYTNEDVIIKTWIILFGDKKSLETRNVRPVMKTTEITDEQGEIIKKVFDLFLDIHKILTQKKKTKIAKKITKKTNLITLTYVLKKAIDNNIESEKTANWIVSFFGTNSKEISINDEYNKNATGRETVTETAVKKRIRILEESFKESVGI